MDVTPRRLQVFQVAQGETVRWAVPGSAGGEVTADPWGLITIPSVCVTKSGVRLRIEK